MSRDAIRKQIASKIARGMRADFGALHTGGFLDAQRRGEELSDSVPGMLSEEARKLLDIREHSELDPGQQYWHRDYAGDMLGFIRDVMGLRHPRTGKLQMWAFQRHLVSALMEHRLVAVTSSRSTSKTHTLGHLIPAFLYTEPSRVIVVGPTMRQITKGVFSEARAFMGKSLRPLYTADGRTSSKEIRIDERHWAIALPASNPENMRGFHASPQVPGDPDADAMSDEDLAWFAEQGEDDSTRILIVVDEASGVNAAALRVLRGMMTKPNVYVIMTGNPTLGADDDHDYVRAFRTGSRYHRIRVSSVPCGEFPAPSGIEYDKEFDRVPNYLVSSEEVAAARREYLPTDPIFLADWAGTFASGSAFSNVVPRLALEAAVDSDFAHLRPLGPRMGVDIGTGNPDPCVAVLYFDGVKMAQHMWAPSSDDQSGQVTTAEIIERLAIKWGRELAEVEHPAGDSLRGSLGLTHWSGDAVPSGQISIDDSGMVGVCDILAARGIMVDRVNFAKSAEGQWRDLVGVQRFLNIRTEMHWVMRRGLQEGVFVIPRTFTQSWAEATWTRFERTYDGKGPIIKLEPKDNVRKRNSGASPDTFDADILAVRQFNEGGFFGQTGAKMQTTKSRRKRGLVGGTKLSGGATFGSG